VTRAALIVALGTVAAALVACPAAVAHGGGAALGYRSTVTKVTPSLSGLEVRVLYGDDELEVTNTAGRRIVVLGYEGEPYLLFTRDGVLRNVRSPATYLNDDRYAKVDVPATANPKAKPQWESVNGGVRYAWHDHRIHWMSTIPPPAVRKAKEVPHHIFNWQVPGTVDGKRIVIAGSLDYAPPKSSGIPMWIVAVAGIGVAALLALAGLVLLRRHRRRAVSAPRPG
jgi:MYXO-CTERM domain-containing protein